LIPQKGKIAMRSVAGSQGVMISGILFDGRSHDVSRAATDRNRHARKNNDAADPAVLSDVFFRIGGAAAGSATNSLIVNSDNVILDDIWAWRATTAPGSVGPSTRPTPASS